MAGRPGPGDGSRQDGGGAPSLEGQAVLALLAAPDADSLLAAALRAARTFLPSAGGVGLLYRLDADGMLRLAAAHGGDEGLRDRYRIISADADLPVAQVTREHEPVYTAPGEYDAVRGDAGDTCDAGVPTEAMPAELAVLPLLVGTRCIGAIALDLSCDGPVSLARHRSFLTLAALCAHRFDQLLDEEPGGAPRPAETPGAGAGKRRVTREGRAPGRDRQVLPLQARDRATMLEMAMANAAIGSFEWDFPTGHLVWDERLCRLFGIAPAEFDGRIETFVEAVHPEDRPKVDAAAKESYVSGRYHVRYRIVRRDDRAVRWIDAESRVLYDPSGEPRGMIGVGRDCTEEQNREDERQARKDSVLNITRAFTAASTTEDVVATVVTTVLPMLGAQRMVLYLLGADGEVHLVGAHGYAEEDQERLREMGRMGLEMSSLSDLKRGEPMFFESRQDFLDRIADERMAPLAGLHAWAMLPLFTSDGILGACVVIYHHPRVFTADDQLVAAGVAGILAQSLARARNFDERRGYLTELQRAMLPSSLPLLPGLDVRVRYRPGSDGLDVGGDWYDALPMPDGRVSVIIGDVQGHSARAAGVMGQLRIAMRAQSADGHQLAALMERGNHTLHDMDTDLFATCCIVAIDPASGRLQVVRAGHPHPLLLAPDGSVTVLEGPGGLPLGIFPDESYPVTEATLPEGGTLLLYTDGLIEKPGTDYDDGVAELARRIGHWAGAGGGPDGVPDLDRLGEQAINPAVSASTGDDVALVLVRRRPRAAGR